MATDFFGYNREVKANGQIMSTEFAVISLGAGKLALVQSVQAAYTQQAQPKFESGSPVLYWLTGQPSGNIQVAKLVGKGGFLSGFSSLKDSCGKLLGATISSDGTGGCSAGFNGKSLTFAGGVCAQVGISWNVQNLEVQESATIQVASMSAS
jgi:hypothetical protein